MDFTTTEAAHDLGGLVDTIVDAVCTPEHQRELDGLEQRFDRELWRKLIDADILTTAAPASLGGDGFGVLEQVAVLVALGHQLAAVPYLESVVLAAGRWPGSAPRNCSRTGALPAVSGEKILTVALDGEMGEGPVQATRAGDGYRLTGTRTLVGYGPVADAFLVPAETDSGTAVFLVAADDPGVSVTALETTGLGSVGHLTLDGIEVDGARMVGGAEVVVWLETLATLGRSAFQLGVLERGLQLTAEYARTREQFDRPIGSFQAVAQRLADGYIDVKGLRLTLTQAAWRVSSRGSARRHRGGQRGVLGGRCRPPGGAHHRARARRRRHRHRSPGAPLLPGRQRSRVRVGRCHRAAAPDRPRAGGHPCLGGSLIPSRDSR